MGGGFGGGTGVCSGASPACAPPPARSAGDAVRAPSPLLLGKVMLHDVVRDEASFAGFGVQVEPKELCDSGFF